MQKSPISRHKLLPLRRFVVPGLYELTYLSVLVQRKKLRAEKLGRNYFTTREWFDNYLEKHARDEKRLKYYKLTADLDQATNTRIKNWQEEEKPVKEKNKYIYYKLAAVSTAVFVLLFFGFQVFVWMDSEKGDVSGTLESNHQATTTIMNK